MSDSKMSRRRDGLPKSNLTKSCVASTRWKLPLAAFGCCFFGVFFFFCRSLEPLELDTVWGILRLN